MAITKKPVEEIREAPKASKSSKSITKPTAIQTELNITPSTTKPLNSSTGSNQDAGCCMGTKTCTTKAVTIPPKTTLAKTTIVNPKSDSKKAPKTRITIKYDVGFNNNLTIRGSSANLSWEKGTLLKNIKNDEWVWETDLSFNSGEFKILINDTSYEAGDNHPLTCGTSTEYTPTF